MDEAIVVIDCPVVVGSVIPDECDMIRRHVS